MSGSLTTVPLTLKQFLIEVDEPIEAAYFIEAGMTSYLAYLEGGEALEAATRWKSGWPAGF